MDYLKSSSSQFLVAVSFLFFFFIGASGATFNVVNDCGFTVWPRILSRTNASIITGFELTNGTSRSFQAPANWRGTIWGRTGCTFDGSGRVSCATGDCDEMDCNRKTTTSPATLAEFNISQNQGLDSYDVTIGNGYNLQMVVEPTGGSGSCAKTGCVDDLTRRCPAELTVEGGGGCKSACQAFGSPEDCCASSLTCKPTAYAQLFKSACPRSYATAFDDRSSIFTCKDANYTVRFCPRADAFSTIKLGGQLRSTDQLVSVRGNFTLGFFDADYRYLGIWYTNDARTRKIWVANRNAPIMSTFGTHALSIDRNTGNMVVTDESGTTLMSITDVHAGPNPNLTATLDDDGNLLLVNEIYKRVLWQSSSLDNSIHQKKEETRRKRDECFLELTASKSFKDIYQLESNDGKGSDLLLFSLASIMAATSDFSTEYKLGEGQGLVEFKNELVLLARLQHTNLVRVLGCCIHGEEKMLIYEYMPNKSLDFFLFDENRRAELNWPRRFTVIEGIAQGLLYLHKYSRMRVIHRDLKASNILLDESLNPKISDFGLAKIFEPNETETTTKRVIGTFGYMSPEYAMKGTFSVKSDVFSFGVLILEIVSGRNNGSFMHHDRELNLIEYVWELWQQGNVLELKDSALGTTCVVQQFLRTVHVALLCVQESAADRPTTSDVISMLLNNTITLPPPNRPPFLSDGVYLKSDSDKSKAIDCSINKLTITVMDGR
ncbi:Bulb-type lectin domain-containing protein [Cynara cardunculus var. scolymus]|uniref:non-specific serine/threonine protein kinase n=1 Tax=Cynara cardunculus var. scolymus TaxID=59895 RepID=A0A103XIX5_CYNCS|nr:Bulb-type lectin domain-containing protein [Cynara cardunculus var. scolymus]